MPLSPNAIERFTLPPSSSPLRTARVWRRSLRIATARRSTFSGRGSFFFRQTGCPFWSHVGKAAAVMEGLTLSRPAPGVALRLGVEGGPDWLDAQLQSGGGGC